MIETLNMIKGFAVGAREMDPLLIGDGRAAIVGRNLGQIEGRGAQRGRVYVHRLAGKSGDVVRKSQTERHVEWLGATVFENPQLLSLVKEFYTDMFETAEAVRPVVAVQTFWQIDETLDCLRAARRSAMVNADIGRALALTLDIERQERLIVELIRIKKYA